MHYTLMSGAGNAFAMIDGFRERAPENLGEVARALCASDSGLSPRPDGLILARPSHANAECAMEIYNADGSRPETCGNGLRCVAKLVADRGHVQADRFVIETDAGLRATQVMRANGRVVQARVHMGTPRILSSEEEWLRALVDMRAATLVDVGNPHCVLVVEDERTAPVTTLGPRLERHARFPEGTNVEFVALRNAGIFLRVWERGVGETQACGSGACAAAVALVERGLALYPVRLQLPGGMLEVDGDGAGGVFLSGPVEEHGSGEWRVASVHASDRPRPV